MKNNKEKKILKATNKQENKKNKKKLKTTNKQENKEITM